MKSINHYLNILSLTLLILSVFFILSGGVTRTYALSIEEERNLGEDFLRELEKKFDFADDYFSTEYINELGNYLIKPVETRPFPFNFHIIRDNSLNAFAGPGGHIFIFTGLIEALDSVDELSAVICHEIAHISARHLSQRIEQNKKIGIATAAGTLAGVLVGGKAGSAIAATTMAAGIQKQLSYSRDDERHADQLGYEYMSESGFNPGALISALEKIQREPTGSGNVPAYLLTHPGASERMANIESMLSSYHAIPENKTVKGLEEEFILFKTMLRAKYQEPQYAEMLFNRELEADPGNMTAHFGLGIVSKESAEYDIALDHFREALKKSPNSLLILRHLGETYQLMGKDREAIRIFDRALGVNNNDRGSLYLKAISLQNIRDYSGSIKLLERLSRMPPVRDEVMYDLGVAYGKLGRLGLAHYNLGIYFSKINDTKMARYHFEIALDNSGNDKGLHEMINKEIDELNKQKNQKIRF